MFTTGHTHYCLHTLLFFVYTPFIVYMLFIVYTHRLFTHIVYTRYVYLHNTYTHYLHATVYTHCFFTLLFIVYTYCLFTILKQWFFISFVFCWTELSKAEFLYSVVWFCSNTEPSVYVYVLVVCVRVCVCGGHVLHLSIMKSCGSVGPTSLGQVTQQIGTKLLWPSLVRQAKRTHTNTHTQLTAQWRQCTAQCAND